MEREDAMKKFLLWGVTLAVVSLPDTDEFGSIKLAAYSVILARQAQCGIDRVGTTGRKKCSCQSVFAEPVSQCM